MNDIIINEYQHKKDNYEYDEKDLSNYYQDKEIAKFLSTIYTNNLKRILKELNNYIEGGDWKNCMIFINKIGLHKVFKRAPYELKKEFLDLIINKLLPNIYIYLESEVDELLELLYTTLKYMANYKIDWKLFYTLFFACNMGKSMSEYKSKLLINLHKFYSEDSITLDDYNILKTSFLDDITNERISNALFPFIYFFPKKYIIEDNEIQLTLLKFLKNKQIYFQDACCFFHKIIRKNGKLYFSKDAKENKIYIETFIKYFFKNLSLFMTGNRKIFRNSYFSPIPISSERDKKKVKFEKSVVSIVIELLFNFNFKEYFPIIENEFKLIIDKKHLFLKEKSNDALSKNYISFLQTFIYGIIRLFHDKIYDKTIGKYNLILKDYGKNKQLYDRLLIILKMISVNMEKLFLYDNEGCCIAQRTLFIFLTSVKFDDEYIKQMLININFEAYIKMIEFLKEYSETRMAKYIMKLYTFMPILLSEYVFTKYSKVRELIKDSIHFLADNLSSANASIDIDILIIFCCEFFRVKELNKQNKIYETLIPLVDEATEKIMNNLLRIIDLVCKNNYYDYRMFVYSMKKYLDKEKFQKIASLYANYLENNEFENMHLDYYFKIIDEEGRKNLFNYIYNTLLFVDKSNNVEINKNFIYEKIDKDFNIDISKCSIEIFSEKQLLHFQRIFMFFDYSKILSNDKNVKKFYELFYALINQKDKKFKNLAIEFFGYVINSLIECKVNEDNILIEYPREYHIKVAIQMYEKVIIPYEKVIADYMKNNPKNSEDKKNLQSEKENKSKTFDKQALEELIETYVRLLHKVNIARCNIFLNLNYEQENIEEYKIIQNQMKIYQKYKSLLKNSLKIITELYDYNGGTSGNYLFSYHKTNLYFDEILAIKIKENSQKIEARKIMYGKLNGIIYKNWLNDFIKLYDINKANIIKITSFEFVKLITPKEESYYTCLKLYLLCFYSVAHPQSIISSGSTDFYSVNKERMKILYNEIYNVFIDKLESLKNDSLVEQNIMKNIANTYYEFSSFYISLYVYDSLNVIEKLSKMMAILKSKKYEKIDAFIYLIMQQISSFLYSCYNKDHQKDRRYNLYLKKNDIVEKIINDIFSLLKKNENRNKYIKLHQDNIETFAKNTLNFLIQADNNNDKSDVKYRSISYAEKILISELLISYVITAIDKKSELYKREVKYILDKIKNGKSPVSSRILWVKLLSNLISTEYASYETFEWTLFKSGEEYMKLFNKLKYEKDGKLLIPSPCERICRRKFYFDEYLNSNANYNLNVNDLLIGMGEIDEYEEDQKLVKKSNLRIFTLDEVVYKKVSNKYDEKKGLDFDKAKMFYYLFVLKYIDINSDFVKKINCLTELTNKSGKKIKSVCVVYEFVLGKYEYMLENNLFGEKERTELWSILTKFTRRIDKREDEKVYAFFNYMFKNYGLRDLEFIFDVDYYKYPLDFVADMSFLYSRNLFRLLTETKMFKKEKMEELLYKILSTQENIILDQNYLTYVLKIYFSTNGMLKYNYPEFKDDYTDELLKFYMEILKKSDTKYRRYGLFLIYNHYFNILNNDLNITKESLQKIALCSNEFKGDKNQSDKKIKDNIENDFTFFNQSIDLPALCDIVVDILIKENDSNDTNKTIYLLAINNTYKGQKFFNLSKYSNKEIFECLFKVFVNIKSKELKKNYSGIFLSYFMDLTEEENKKFIETYEKYIFENVKKEDEDKNKYNYVRILMIQLLRFKIRLPDYIQEFIIKLKVVDKIENNELKKIVKDALKFAMEYYKGSYIYMKKNISEECKNVLEELTKGKSYFI